MPKENEFKSHDEPSEKTLEQGQDINIQEVPEISQEILRKKEKQLLVLFDSYINIRKEAQKDYDSTSVLAITSKNPDFARKTIQTLIDDARNPQNYVKNMERAESIALTSGDVELVEMVKGASKVESIDVAMVLGDVEPLKAGLKNWAERKNYPSEDRVFKMISVAAENDPAYLKEFLEERKNDQSYEHESRYDMALTASAVALAKKEPDFSKKVLREFLNKPYSAPEAGKIAIALRDVDSAKKAAEKCLSGYPDQAAKIALAIGDQDLIKKALENSKRYGPKTAGPIAIILGDYDYAKEALQDCVDNYKKRLKTREGDGTTDSCENWEKAATKITVALGDRDPAYAKEMLEKFFNDPEMDNYRKCKHKTGGVPTEMGGVFGARELSIILADKDPETAQWALKQFAEIAGKDNWVSKKIQAKIFEKNFSRINISSEEAAKMLKDAKGEKIPLALGWFLNKDGLHNVESQITDPATLRIALLGEMLGKDSGSSSRELLDIAFSSPSSKNFERMLSKSLILFGYEQVSNILMQKIQNVKDEKMLARYLKTLIEIENPKGRTMATDLFANQQANPHLRRYFAKKLIAEKHWDPNLGTILQKGVKEGKEQEVDDTLVAMIKDLGLTPDKPSYEALEKPGILQGATLQERVQELKSLRQEFAELSHDKLKERLKDEKIRQVFYLVKGGEYRYILINDYSYEKFSMIVGKVLEEEVDEEKIGEFDKSLEVAQISSDQRQSIIQSLKEGRFPLENPEQRSFSFETSVEVGSEYEIAFQRLQEIWGRELKILATTSEQEGELPLGIDDALANLEGKEIEKPKSKRALDFLKQGEKQDYKSIKKISETCKKELVASLKQKAKQSKDKDAKKEKLAELERLNISGVLHAFIVERLPKLKDSAVLSEWESHLRDTLSTLEAGPVNGGTKSKRLELTFLDKGKDFIRSVRFADGRQCCFNSSNYNAGGGGASEWISKLNADPLSFIVDVKEEGSRIISGFVFGRMGIDTETKRPVVMCNGIYSQESGGTIANNILRLIEEKFAKRIGASSMVIASKYGGTLSQTPTGFSAVEKEIQAIRALKKSDKVYDDIGTVPNGRFTFKGYERKLF